MIKRFKKKERKIRRPAACEHSKGTCLVVGTWYLRRDAKPCRLSARRLGVEGGVGVRGPDA